MLVAACTVTRIIGEKPHTTDGAVCHLRAAWQHEAIDEERNNTVGDCFVSASASSGEVRRRLGDIEWYFGIVHAGIWTVRSGAKTWSLFFSHE